VGGGGFEAANKAHGSEIITNAADFEVLQLSDALANVSGCK
jgi:hypothetical protein